MITKHVHIKIIFQISNCVSNEHGKGDSRIIFLVYWEWVASLGTLLWISLVERFFLPVQKKDVSDDIRTLFVQIYSSLHRYM